MLLQKTAKQVCCSSKERSDFWKIFAIVCLLELKMASATFKLYHKNHLLHYLMEINASLFLLWACLLLGFTVDSEGLHARVFTY